MTNNKIQAYAERIENVLNEIDTLRGDIKDLYEEVKSAEFNPRALRKAIANKRRKADAAFDAEVEGYSVMLGVALVRGEGLSLREAEKRSGASKSSIHRALSVPEVSQPEESGDRQSPSWFAALSADVTTASASSSPPIGWELGGSSIEPFTDEELRLLKIENDALKALDLTIPAHLRRIA